MSGSGFLVSGHDLDTIYAPYVSGAKAAATGYLVGGVDLNSRYAPGSTTNTTGFTVNGADLSTFFTYLSGGAGDPGGHKDCVCGHMFLRADLLARDAVVGDLFDCMDLRGRGRDVFQHALQSVEEKLAPCLRLSTDAGAVLDCSTRTPFDLLDGRDAWAPDMMGEQVITDWGVETVVSVESIGLQSIYHNHLGGLLYAAGRVPTHRIFSHNSRLKF